MKALVKDRKFFRPLSYLAPPVKHDAFVHLRKDVWHVATTVIFSKPSSLPALAGSASEVK